MKNLLSILSVLLFSSFAFAQSISEKEVPNSVKAAFSKKFPNQKNVKWEKEKENYEASFSMGKTEHAAVIDSKGNLLETEEEISVKELPADAVAYIQKNYSGKKIKEAAKITDAKGIVTFEAEVASKDLIFEKTGIYIKSIAD